MTDIAKLGIGLETTQAERNAKNLTKDLDGITKSVNGLERQSQSMAKSMIAAQASFEVAKKAASFLSDQFLTAIQTGAQFEQQMANVKAVSGATEEQFKQLEAAALQMGKTTSFNASQSASALEAMSKAGFQTSESIAALDEVLQLSAASGMALGESANLITNIMSSMGAEVEDLTHINNVLVKTFTGTNTTLQGLGQTFTYAGGIAATTKVSIEELAAAAGILGNAGIDASRAGTALRSTMTRLIDPTKKTTDVLKRLNVEAGQNLIDTLADLEKAGASTQDMIKIFGQEAGGALAALQQAGGIQAVERLAEELENVGDVAEKLAKQQLDTLQGDLKLLQSAIENVQIQVFRADNEALREAVQAVTRAVNNAEQGLIAMGTVTAEMITYFVQLGEATEDTGSILEGILPVFQTIVTAVTLVGGTFEQVGELIGVFANNAWEVLYGLGTSLENLVNLRFSDAFNSIKTGFGNAFENTKDLLKSNIESIKDYADVVDKIWSVSTKKQTEEIKEQNKEIKKTKAELETEAYIAEQLLKPAIEDSIQIFGELVEKEKEVKDATEETNNIINTQADVFDKVAESTKKATEEVKKYADANARALGTGDVLGMMGGLVGSTFSIPTVGRGATASQTTAGAGAVSTSGVSNLRNQIAQFENLQSQILNYLNSQQSLDIRLADAKRELRDITEDLAGLNESQLEKRYELSKDYFDTAKEIDNLEKQMNERELSHLNTLDGIMSSLDSDYRELQQGNLSQIIPVDRLKALETEFSNIANAVDNIDFSEITSADTQLIAQFQNVSKEFLGQAQDVFASSENYQVIKNNVKSEFEELSNNITAAMGGAKNSVDALGIVSGVTSSNVLELAQSANGLGTASNDSADKTDKLSDATQNAGYGADALNAAMGGSTSNFTNMTGNMNTLLSNLNLTVSTITEKFAAMGQAISTGETLPTGTTPQLEQPTTITKQWTDFIVGQDYAGRYQLKATANTGDTKVLGVTTYGYNVSDFGSTASIYNEQLQKQDQFEIINGQLYKNGSAMSLKRGAWRINSDTGANLHEGEMVIRSDDAPAVRSMMRQSGMSQNYGVAPTNTQQPTMAQNRIVELLAELVSLMQGGLNPIINLNARKLNEELDRQRALATA